ncbi:hypothetical protein [Commensalibacter papalotli (ex Botero et al. 2024)]|uniref:Uncharacterized protein n=1 Tax=Commensalibacter papalotli (ex Botero et al. 2024) TaxID=2972766 RepID=A0ABN8W461_9PROT|nr:hypothetical protein [Commensalibacter papalotli (ex Botero et al. 2024)]CAI3932072.1 unnamed protein product [Commensalibacter papalotli (ex Botero et al. 2024)]CAI3946607.1 unnamed protein product [Commensalibacter papalotli (ex Botero et al. 2024)]
MDLVIFLKAGIVGSFGFVIAIGVVMTLLISVSKSLQEASVQARKLPSFIVFLIVFLIELGIAYWYFSSVTEISTPSALDKFTMYACLFSLAPSVAIIMGALFYYCDAQKTIQGKDQEKL